MAGRGCRREGCESVRRRGALADADEALGDSAEMTIGYEVKQAIACYLILSEKLFSVPHLIHFFFW